MTHKHSWVVIAVTLALIGAMSGLNAPNAYADGTVEDVDLQAEHVALVGLVSANTEEVDTNGVLDPLDPTSTLPNGILDAAELLMVETILEDASLDLSGTGGVAHAGLHAAWTTNLAITSTGCAGCGAFGVTGVLAAYTLLGTTSATLFTAGAFGALGGDPATFAGLDFSMGAFLDPAADADGDGFSNLEEWDFFGAPLLGTLRTVHEAATAAYVAAALNAASFPVPPPPGVTTFTSDGGGVFTLTFDEAVNDVDNADFQIVLIPNAVGGALALTAGVDGDTVYEVTVTGVTGDGAFAVRVLPGGITAVDDSTPLAVGKTSASENVGSGPGLSSLQVPFFQE